MKITYGNVAWVMNKAFKATELYGIYKASKSESAAIDVATEFAELVGIGIPFFLWIDY